MNCVWEQCKLGEVFEQTSNLINLNDGEIELWSLTVEDGLTPKSERYNREFLVKKDNNFKEVRPGEIVYNPMNMTLGAVGYNEMSKSVAVSGYYTTMLAKKGYDSCYINTWLKSLQAISLYKTYATGSLIEKQRVQFPTLSIIPATFPNCEEQTKIGTYFANLDHLITLHQCTIDIDVLNYACVWEQRKFTEFVSFYNGLTYTPDDVKDSGTLVLRSSNVKNGEIVDADNVYVNTEAANSENVQDGDIIVVVRNGSRALIGKHAQIKGSMDNTVIGAFMSGIRSDHSSFVNALLDTPTFEIEIAKNLGATINQITGYMFSKMEFAVPSDEEQEQIGLYFSNLDRLITLHQCKCTIIGKDTINDWEQRKLGDMFHEYSEKNHPELPALTIMQGNGTVLREESDRNLQYDKSSLSGYKRVNENDFIVHLRSFEGGLEKSNHNGLISPAYHTFHGGRIDSRFYYPYFRSYEFIKHKLVPHVYGIRDGRSIDIEGMKTIEIPYTSYEEQKKIGNFIESLDNLITLHQYKCTEQSELRIFDWEQRKLNEITDVRDGTHASPKYFEKGHPFVTSKNVGGGFINYNDIQYISDEDFEEINKRSKVDVNDILMGMIGTIGNIALIRTEPDFAIKNVALIKDIKQVDYLYIYQYLQSTNVEKQLASSMDGGTQKFIALGKIRDLDILFPSKHEQVKLGKYFESLDNLITLHQQKYIYIEITLKYMKIALFIKKETIIMPELESMIENKLIEQLVYGDSQWTYRDDLKTEEDLWKNFRYILEQNNKDRLDGESLSDAEFEQVKNQLQFSSFYKAGEWLVGENGKVQVHVQRDTQRLHLVIMNHEHIAGGSSVYEVINQYSALSIDDEKNTPARDRRFDVTLMINGLPMIHIELKNKQHSYMDGFWQIKKYIGEGKFTGIFSAVQMFVISNGVNTKYFSAASDTELNPKFISGWLDKKNNPVPDYLDFAKNVLRIPEAHEMIARYTVLDEDAKRLILLRPYQIHAIEAIRDASKTGKSGFVWHTTGSGKTLTSYKATRNLLMDIPAIDKAIFLIDRKDLDTQTTMAFQAYANNDLIDVDETENINDLKKKLKSDDRQVIVTTIQKLHLLISKRLKEGTLEYNKIRNLKIAYVVDECHRAVTPSTKRELERFFGNSLWFGFTGTPRFKENPYPQLGDLPRTTETLYGVCLHKYTIQNAIHDNAVLGFQVEHNGPKNIEDETDSSAYNNEVHMLKVLNVIINKSYHKLGFQNGKGLTYEGLLTTNSIGQAQKYYELLTRVKNGETSLQIDDRIKQVLPDFPKFAITYSVTENEEGSQVNQQKMQGSLDDYNKMFGTKYEMSQIQGYNGNLNKRLARKDTKYKSRSEQLDLVIVVDRLLTGFDAPCLSTIFIDRQPMGPHDLIQAFSRTNRIFDKNKAYGQIVTFQAPVLFKKCVDDAVKLYSAGGTGIAILAEWNEIEPAFKKSLSALRVSAPVPSDIAAMSLKEKEVFAKMFQNFDKLFAQLKSFTNYEDGMLEEYGITEKEYEDYAGHYENVMEEINENKPDKPDDPDTPDVDPDYELMAYSHTKIDYEYIINLIQNIVTPDEDGEEVSPEERQKKLEEVKQYVEELRKENPKVAEIMSNLINEIELDENKYKGQSILNIVENMKHTCIDQVITDFCIQWYASKEDVMYAATHYRNGEIPNESAIKATIDYTSYKSAQEHALPKFKYYAKLMAELRNTLEQEIKPLVNH